MEIKDLCELYNTTRLHYGNRQFKGKEINNALGNIGFPKGNSFRVFASKFGLIFKTGKGHLTVWQFSKEPVHITKIENALKAYRSEQKKYYKQLPKVNASIISDEENVNKAIELLKSLGYKIQKQVIIYEEV